MTKDHPSSLPDTARLGCPLHTFPSLPSTSDHLKALAAGGAGHGTTVIADHQAAGRGRKGRTFFSPTGGLYLSVLLRRPIPATAVGRITLSAAVAVANAIEALCPVTVGIKWVNDLVIDGKKICGILTEGELNPATGVCDYAIVGIGINLSTADFPPELQHIATSLALAAGVTPDRDKLVAEILARLEKVLDEPENGAVLEEYRRRCVVLGKRVTVIRPDETYEARAVAIDDNGQLVVETPTASKTLSSGEVSIKL